MRRTLLGGAPRLAVVLMTGGGLLLMLLMVLLRRGDNRGLRRLRLVLLKMFLLHLNLRWTHGDPDS